VVWFFLCGQIGGGARADGQDQQPTEILALRTDANPSIGAFLGTWFAARFLVTIVVELRTALAAEAEHEDLVRRSARQLTRMGLKRADLPDHIPRRYYS
jgi:hypothetical protein